MKEATDSVLERHTISDVFKHQGECVVFGQRLMQASIDLFLGFASSPTNLRKRTDLHVRQLNDYKSSADTAAMDETIHAGDVELCAETRPRAHVLTRPRAHRQRRFHLGLSGKGQTFDNAMGAFSVAYADQDRKDHRAFARAGKEGPMEVISGV